MRYTAAQSYNLVIGVTLVLVALIGFTVDHSFSMGHAMHHHRLFGLFAVNGWHNLVHLITGAAALAVVTRTEASRTFALTIGALYALLTVAGMALASGNGLVELVAMNPADNLLHLALGIAGIVAGLASPRPVTSPAAA